MPHSQSNEDQILKSIFAKLQIKTGTFVELGARDGINLSNTRSLYLEGWTGVLIEADPAFEETLNHNSPKTKNFISKISLEHPNQLDDILDMANLPNDYDLLSLDIDGIDYWVLKNLRRSPKVIVVEYNSNFNDTRTIDYDPNFCHQLDDYFGATPKALQEALTGYTPVNFTNGLNVFFVRNDLMKDFHQIDLNRIPVNRGWPDSQRGDIKWIHLN